MTGEEQGYASYSLSTHSLEFRIGNSWIRTPGVAFLSNLGEIVDCGVTVLVFLFTMFQTALASLRLAMLKVDDDI